MDRSLPRNGLLSGMVLTWGAGAVAAVLGLVPALHGPFVGEASDALLNGFGLSVLALIAHKVESYRLREYDACPVYATMGSAPVAANPRQQIFVSGIPVLMAGVLVVAVVMRGPPWVLLFFLIWAGQGLHEWHHLGKTLASRRYYPGLVTGLLFVASVDVLVYPAWVACLEVDPGPWYAVFYGAQPLVLLAFFAEHRRWRAAANAALGEERF